MDRRLFIGSVAAITAALSKGAVARIFCGPVQSGVALCEAGLQTDVVEVIAPTQHESQWCWAACIEMIFRYYGFDIAQEQVVQETWGAVLNTPAGLPQIMGALNRVWVDARGYRLRVSSDVSTANPATAAQDLAQDMPLIIGTMGHAM
jgi:hypothetical protein